MFGEALGHPGQQFKRGIVCYWIFVVVVVRWPSTLEEATSVQMRKVHSNYIYIVTFLLNIYWFCIMIRMKVSKSCFCESGTVCITVINKVVLSSHCPS